MANAGADQLAGFETGRLSVQAFVPLGQDGQMPAALAGELRKVLTPRCLQHLPGHMQLGPAPDDGEIGDWVRDRLSESQLLVIRDRSGGDLLGLLILAAFGGAAQRVVHIGYLLSEACWGQGYGSECIHGLVAEMCRIGVSVLLMAGVGHDNPASARILLKAGFTRDAARSTADSDMFTLAIGPAGG